MIKNEEDEIIIKLLDDEICEKVNLDTSKIINCTEEKSKNEINIKINKNNTISVCFLKIIISDIKNVSSEKIHLFIKDTQQNKKKPNDDKKNKNNIISIQNLSINDFMKNKIYLEELKDDIDSIYTYPNMSDRQSNLDNAPPLYYLISNNNNNFIDNYTHFFPVCVIIDFYQQNIDKIFLTLQSNCSLCLLKYIINNKLNNISNINQLKLFCIDITQINSETNKKNLVKNNNTPFSERKTLDDIISFFFPNSNININNNNINSNIKYTLHFLLTIKNDIGSSEQIGLNFRFNYLKDVSKISFNKNAPEYCECSDGINLFAFCFNQECLLYNKYFVVNLGYGLFNILKRSKNIKCPKCGDFSSIEIKNIGIINSKYFYSGKLKAKEKEKSSFEGDGITLDDKLYIFKEAKINSFLVQLYIEAKPHFMIMNKMLVSKRTKEDEELDDIALCDDIKTKTINNNNNNNNSVVPPLFTTSTLGLEYNNYKYMSGFSSKSPQHFLKNINTLSNKVKIYDNESEILEKNDVIVDKIDDKSLNSFSSINCIGDADIFSAGCFPTKKVNEFENSDFQKSSFCSIF